MKKTLIRMLVCCMALALMLTTAFATEAAQSADRVTVLAVQTTGASELADELTSALAMVPALGVDYVVRYDDGHLSLCDLTAAQTYSERGAALDAWNAEFVKARSRNASHHTLWNLMASLPADYAIDLAKVDVLWLPAYDLAEDQWQNVTPGLSQLTACGGTLRLFATSAVPQLSQKLASYTNTTVTAVSNPGFDVFDLLLTEAGYYHVSDDAAKAMMRRTELQPASALPGDSVVIDRCAEYNLAGHTYTCGSITVGFTDSAHVGMAVVPVPHAEAEPEAQATVAVDNAEADETVSADEQTDAVPENVSASASTLVNQTQSEVAEHSVQDELELVIAPIVSQHQLCWYFKPVAATSVTMKPSPALIPFSLDETLTVTLTLESASELEAAHMCSVNLLDEAAGFKLAAVLRHANGRVQVLRLTAGSEPGTYQATFERPNAGQYSILATITRKDIPFTYPAIETVITVEAPVRITAASDIAPVKLVVSPMLWHSGDTEVTLHLADYFNGSYVPVACRSYNEQLVQVAPAGLEGLTLTALEEGQTQLFLLARDGETSAVVPVEITNGQKLVLMEAAALLIAVLLVLYTVLFARLKQPRFRKGEKMSVSIDDGVPFSLPLKSYRAGGVTLWRLLVLGARAADHKADSATLRRIVFLPKLDQVIVKQDKLTETMITGQTVEFSCGEHRFAVTLEATDPNA